MGNHLASAPETEGQAGKRIPVFQCPEQAQEHHTDSQGIKIPPPIPQADEHQGIRACPAQDGKFVPEILRQPDKQPDVDGLHSSRVKAAADR